MDTVDRGITITLASHSLTHSHTHTLSLTHTHSRTHDSHTRISLTHTHTHTHTHAHTHTHTHEVTNWHACTQGSRCRACPWDLTSSRHHSFFLFFLFPRKQCLVPVYPCTRLHLCAMCPCTRVSLCTLYPSTTNVRACPRDLVSNWPTSFSFFFFFCQTRHCFAPRTCTCISCTCIRAVHV